MIKGIISFLFRPLVLIGICGGVYSMLTMDVNQIIKLAQNVRICGGMFLLALIYTLIFKRVYNAGANGINWKATISEIFKQFFVLIFAIILGCLSVKGYEYATSDQTIAKIKNNRNVKILVNEAQSATNAPTLPGE